MSWLENVTDYFDTLEPLAAQLRKGLVEIRKAVAVADNELFRTESVQLGVLGEELKLLFQKRLELLHAVPTEEFGSERLLTILSRFQDAEAKALLQRGRHLERVLRENQTLAQSLLVAEYNLIQSTQDVLAILTGHSPFQHPCEATPLHPGCVLDRAA
jgi:hypothetical protein